VQAGGDRERVMSVAFGMLRLTLRDRRAGPPAQRQHQPPAGRRRDRVVGPAAGPDQIPARQRDLGTISTSAAFVTGIGVPRKLST